MSETEPPPPLHDDLRALLARAAGLERAPADVRARLRARVEAADVSGGRPAPPAPRPPAGLLRRMLPLAVSFVLGAGAGGLVVARALRPRATEAPRVVYVDRPVLAPAVPAQARAVTVDAPAEHGHRAPPGGPGPLAAERRLLDVARGALERGQPAAALDATARHERLFPRGVLVQEREAMAIRALAMLGRLPDARARADRFRARFPDSVLWPAIASAVGASSPP